MLIDDFSDPTLLAPIGHRWRAISDGVMGGVSQCAVTHAVIDGRSCLRLTGDVRLDNNGGFVQAGLELASGGGRPLDAAAFTGIRLLVRGNDERYSLHLRTPDCARPWQSFRCAFDAGPEWQTVDVPFSAFEPHRLSTPLDPSRLRRLGLFGIGRAFRADLAVARIECYT